MAIVKGPLFSISASGKIADSLVYFPWKGLDVVRQWLIPANPRTPAQTAIRADFSAAVAEWHAALYNALDREAWRRAAVVHPRVMTGFNRMIMAFITVVWKTALVWRRLRGCVVSAVTSSSFMVSISTSPATIVAPVLTWGLTPQTLLNTVTMAGVGVSPYSEFSTTISGLTARTRYYFRIVSTDVAERGETGIYEAMTL